MKKVIGILLAVFLLGFCSNVLAIDLAGKFGFTGKGELGIPMGDFADDEKVGADMVGYGFGATAEYFLTDQVALGGYFDYMSFGVVEPLHEPEVDIDASVKLNSFGAFVKYIFSTNTDIAPYLRVGAGMYRPKELFVFSGGGSASSSFDMKFGFTAGAGVMFKASDFVLIGAEVMFHDAMVKKAEHEGVEFGYDLQYIQINAGITFLVGGE